MIWPEEGGIDLHDVEVLPGVAGGRVPGAGEGLVGVPPPPAPPTRTRRVRSREHDGTTLKRRDAEKKQEPGRDRMYNIYTYYIYVLVFLAFSFYFNIKHPRYNERFSLTYNQPDFVLLELLKQKFEDEEEIRYKN